MFFQTGVIGQKRGEWRKTWVANEKMEALSWETSRKSRKTMNEADEHPFHHIEANQQRLW
jgi:hypothetical protein